MQQNLAIAAQQSASPNGKTCMVGGIKQLRPHKTLQPTIRAQRERESAGLVPGLRAEC